MGMAAILVMWPGLFEQTFVPPSHGGSIWNLTLIGQAVSEKKMFKRCGWRTDDGWTVDVRRRPTYPISSPVSLWLKWAKKAPGHGHTTTWYKYWQHFKAFIIPIILYQFQKAPYCLIILYAILFYFIHVYKAPGQDETTLGNTFFDASRNVLSRWSLGCMFQKILPSDLMHIFSWFYTCT